MRPTLINVDAFFIKHALCRLSSSTPRTQPTRTPSLLLLVKETMDSTATFILWTSTVLIFQIAAKAFDFRIIVKIIQCVNILLFD